MQDTKTNGCHSLKDGSVERIYAHRGTRSPAFSHKTCFVESVTGYSLYQEILPPVDAQAIAEKLAKALGNLSDETLKEHGITRTQAVALAQWFQTCAQNKYFIVGK